MSRYQRQRLSPAEELLNRCRTLLNDCEFFVKRLEEDLSALEDGTLEDGQEWSAEIRLEVFQHDFSKHLRHAEESARWFDACHKNGEAFESE